MNRRAFLVSVVARPAAGLAVLAAACGGDDDGATPTVDAPPPSCLERGTSTFIIGNHGHVMMVSKEDVAAGQTITYDLSGDHSHRATVTAAMFARLAANLPVSITTTVDLGHSHDISIRCV